MTTAFETDRLVVRDWSEADAERMHDMYSRLDVVRFLGSVPTPMPSVEAAHARIERGRLRNDEERAAGAPYDLKFMRVSPKKGFRYACAVHGGMMTGTVIVS